MDVINTLNGFVHESIIGLYIVTMKPKSCKRHGKTFCSSDESQSSESSYACKQPLSSALMGRFSTVLSKIVGLCFLFFISTSFEPPKEVNQRIIWILFEFVPFFPPIF